MFKDKGLEKSKENLSDNNKRFRSILETTQDGFFIFDKNKKIIDVNNAYCEMSGYIKEELLNLSISDIDLSDSFEKIEVEGNLLSKGHDLFETKHLRKNGEIFDVEVSISLLNEEPGIALCFCRDITEKKKDKRKILQMKERLENIIEATNVGTWIWNIKSGEIIINKKWTEILGYTLDELSPITIETWEKLTHSDDLKKAQKKLKKVMSREIDSYYFEHRMKHKNGRWIWMNGRGKVTKWSKENLPLIMSGTHFDITDRKENEYKVIEIKERLANIIKGTDAGTWVHYIKTDKEIVNERWAEIIGYELKEITPIDMNRLKKITHPKDLKLVEREFQKTINQEIKYYDVEFRIKHKKGKWVWINSRGKITKWSKDGTPFLISGTTIDITEKKKNEQKIVEMKERLENIIEGTNVGTWEWKVETGELDINYKWAEMLGYTLEEISPFNVNTWERLTHPADLNNAQKKLNKALDKEIDFYDSEIRMKHKNGKWKWINDRGKVTKWSEDGKAILMSGTHTDITERKQEQEKIEYLSFHDHLTGLYNRRYMEDSIKRLDTDRNIPFSIISADVDNLKLTNDAYGHEMGDKILIKAAEILKKSCRKEDIICRVSGDEFLILLPSIGEKKVQEIIERINEESENVDFVPLIVSMSTGYSTKNKEEENILKVYKEADNNMYKNKIKYGRTIGKKVIEKIQSNLNAKYDNERIHSERVSYYCEIIAKAMKLGHKEIKDAKLAGKLHDIGKIAISEDILKKEKKLKEEEFQEFKKHPSTSYQLLRNVDDYNHIAEAVLYHHERLDGSGYQGLKKNEIPLLSKIIAVADRYVEMTEGYPYQNKTDKGRAIEELKKKSGIKFSNDIVESLTKIV